MRCYGRASRPWGGGCVSRRGLGGGVCEGSLRRRARHEPRRDGRQHPTPQHIPQDIRERANALLAALVSRFATFPGSASNFPAASSSPSASPSSSGSSDSHAVAASFVVVAVYFFIAYRSAARLFHRRGCDDVAASSPSPAPPDGGARRRSGRCPTPSHRVDAATLYHTHGQRGGVHACCDHDVRTHLQTATRDVPSFLPFVEDEVGRGGKKDLLPPELPCIVGAILLGLTARAFKNCFLERPVCVSFHRTCSSRVAGTSAVTARMSTSYESLTRSLIFQCEQSALIFLTKT